MTEQIVYQIAYLVAIGWMRDDRGRWRKFGVTHEVRDPMGAGSAVSPYWTLGEAWAWETTRAGGCSR